MQISFTYFIRVVFLVVIIALWPNVVAANPSFPGAEGFGATASGGRGYPVFHVTTLIDGIAPGQFGWAVNECKNAGGGNIVFDVAGEIILIDGKYIPKNVTIAGQTAPGGGIAFSNEGLAFVGGNNIMRHVRMRGSAYNSDGFNIFCKNVIIDHVSISWACDGAIDIVAYGGGPPGEVTIQWCHLGDHATCHDEGHHADLVLTDGLAANLTFHHNLWTYAQTRGPWYSQATYPGSGIEFSNNIHYDYLKMITLLECNTGKANVVGNYYIPCVNSHADEPYKYSGGQPTQYRWPNGGMRPPIVINNNMTAFCYNNRAISGWGHTLYDNEKSTDTGDSGWVEGTRPDESYDEWSCVGSGSFGFGPFPGVRNRSEQRLDMPLVTYHQTDSNYNYVLDRFGAFPRDNTDKRLETEVRTRTGRWRDAPMKAIDQNVYTGTPVVDTDRDGIPDEWEKTHNLNPNDSSDGNGTTLNAEGYTNFEVYINERADSLVPAMPLKPAFLDLKDYMVGGKMINVEKGFANPPAGYDTNRHPVAEILDYSSHVQSRRLLAVSPNPFYGHISFSINRVEAGYADKSLSFSIYNISGKKIMEKVLGYGNGLIWQWDGMDCDGKMVPEGFYLVSFSVGGRRIAQEKVMLLR